MAQPRDTSDDVGMSNTGLRQWMGKHNHDEGTLAEWLGLTRQAVKYWVTGEREIPEPIGRLLNFFDNYPDQMGRF